MFKTEIKSQSFVVIWIFTLISIKASLVQHLATLSSYTFIDKQLLKWIPIVYTINVVIKASLFFLFIVQNSCTTLYNFFHDFFMH